MWFSGGVNMVTFGVKRPFAEMIWSSTIYGPKPAKMIESRLWESILVPLVCCHGRENRKEEENGS
jgi:hypothetical protein